LPDPSRGVHTPAMSTWREKLQKVMDDRGITQYRLAEMTGIRQPRISTWLAGKGEPGLDQWGLICRALDVPLSTFLPDHLADDVPDYRTPDEQMLAHVARKVGVRKMWELIVKGAGGEDPSAGPGPGPPSGPIKPIRTIGRQVGGAHDDPPAGPGEGEASRKPPKRRK
jgi:transcriptional regulator with XRE-family HTH domain